MRDFRPHKAFEGIVVCEVAQALHIDEMLCEVLNCLWEPLQNTPGTPFGTLLLDLPMV